MIVMIDENDSASFRSTDLPAAAVGDAPDSAEGQFCSSCFKRTFCLGGMQTGVEVGQLPDSAVEVAGVGRPAGESISSWDANRGLALAEEAGNWGGA